MALLRTLFHAVVVAAALAYASGAGAVTFVSCTFKGLGDPLERGFYITGYDGLTLATVTLGHAAVTPGERTIALTARINAYNGSVIGVAVVTRTIGPEMSATTFDFGNVPVPLGVTIAFTQAIAAGDVNVTYDRGAGNCPGVTQTFDSAPLLSEALRDTVGLVVTGSPAAFSSAAVLTCPLDPLGRGESTTRAFYVTNYGGVRLGTVTMQHRAATQGKRRIELTAYLGGFDGPEIATGAVDRVISSTGWTTSTFNLKDTPVPAGATIAFVQRIVEGVADDVSHDIGFGPCPDVVQTDLVKADVRASVGLTITGRVANTAPLTVVEYFHTGFGHYFMTADPAEIAGLDGGAYGGVFTRTGQVFKALDGPAAGAIAVCRFFTVAFAPKSSHFYTADSPECAGLKSNPNWQYEKIAFFNAVPYRGACPQDTVPVYRVYNNGMTGAPNHRFTTSLAIHDDFVQNRGWTSVGVRFCAPV